jgi:hypothetical protein
MYCFQSVWPQFGHTATRPSELCPHFVQSNCFPPHESLGNLAVPQRELPPAGVEQAPHTCGQAKEPEGPVPLCRTAGSSLLRAPIAAFFCR